TASAGRSCGLLPDSEALGQTHDETSAVQVIGIITVGGDLLVGEVIDARLEAPAILWPVHQARVDKGIGRVLDAVGAGATGTGLPAAGGLAPVIDLGPEVQAGGHAPIQRRVEHVPGNVVQRLALVLARLLLGIGKGVTVAVGQVIQDVVVQGELDAPQLRLVDVLVGGIAELVRRVFLAVVDTAGRTGGDAVRIVRADAAGTVDLVLVVGDIG